MTLTEAIVSIVNQSLAKLCLANDMLGIAVIAQEQRNEKLISGPVIKVEGEYQIIPFDGPVIYHRAISAQFQQSNKQGYGDERNPIIARYRMTMVVFAKKENNLPADIVEMIMAEWPNKTIKSIVEGVKNTDITINDAVLDESQAFNEEFKGIERFFGPEYCLLKVNYTAESTVLSKCFKNVCK